MKKSRMSILNIELSDKMDLGNSLGARREAGIVENGDCFRNSAKILISLPENHYYVEGLAISGKIGIPLLHAWVTGPNGIIDVTWAKDEPEEYPLRKYRPLLVMSKPRFMGLILSEDYGFPLLSFGNLPRETAVAIGNRQMKLIMEMIGA